MEEPRMVLETDPLFDPGGKCYGTDLITGLTSVHFTKPALTVGHSMGLKSTALSFKKSVFTIAGFPGVSGVVKQGCKAKWVKAKYLHPTEKFL